MLEIHKSYLLDEKHQAIAVQIPIDEYEKIEEILENFGLSQLMSEAEGEEYLAKDEAWTYYRSLKAKDVESQRRLG